MNSNSQPEEIAEKLDELAASPDLADALASDRFKQFLDHVPVAILVTEIRKADEEQIVYANHEAELILGVSLSDIENAGWSQLDDRLTCDGNLSFSAAVVADEPPSCSFLATPPDAAPLRHIEFQAALVTGEDDQPRFRLVALIDVTERDAPQREAFEAQLRDKDVLLREIQHRVKNNLQIVTALIRMEARRAGSQIGTGPFERLAGRIEALGLLYRQLSFDDAAGAVDLGSLLSEIAGSVIRSQGTEGVRLELHIEPCWTTLDVAMPIGLLVNELLTNAMKYAFEGRGEGVVTVRCLKEGENECVVSVTDDGVGLPEGEIWPQPGKLGALMVSSLEANTRAKVEVGSSDAGGLATTIRLWLAPPARNSKA
ncbi:sensor histidine kinase [Hansschlegelia sp.]|uniref:sensor histidine kinase n=1 Tax=Hansschlegelia sp. TaxID=2041892 RepID=UPI002D1798BE|nr:histidine kinase dimerization/phosphoacceptor domain -containing protein [Hansschlegelia sp.]HVI29148.1 histidine kinase dimerization/phosphoacceptor domain -containing protein [Hansschlegelia sp.]